MHGQCRVKIAFRLGFNGFEGGRADLYWQKGSNQADRRDFLTRIYQECLTEAQDTNSSAGAYWRGGSKKGAHSFKALLNFPRMA